MERLCTAPILHIEQKARASVTVGEGLLQLLPQQLPMHD